MDRTGMECGYCDKDQVQPKLLPCLHSFCLECLKEAVRDKPRQSWLRCPLCYKHVDLPSSGLDGLEDNLYTQFSDLHVPDTARCDVCAERHVTCRCAECRRNFCTDCVRVHLNQETSKSHSITGTMPGMVGGASDQVTCRDHALELEKYCITCSEPICTRCASSKHNNHVTEDTRRTANERRIELQSLVTDSNIRRQIKGREDYIRATRQDRAKLETDITLTVKAIQSHIKCIKDELDATGDKLIGDLKDKRTQWLANMDKNITEFVSNQKATQAVVVNTQLIVERARDIELLAKYPDIKAAITETKTSRHPSFGQVMKVDFIPLSVNTACGRVDVKASLKRPLEMYEVGSALFQKHPTSICPTNNGKAWVAHRKCIQVVNRDGGMGTRIDLMEPVLCVSQNSRGKIYMACPSSVKCINSRSEPKQCFSLLHQASDMTFTESDDLLICFKDARRISMFDVKGKIIKELDARGFTYIYGTRITDPWNVAINDNTHDIYVSDYSSENIAVFDQKGDIKSSFRCNVHRHAMLSCHRGLLYIADNRRDCVHVLSESGQLLQTCSTAGISGPWSIAVDTAGLLWLGFWAGNLKIYTIR